MPTPVLRTPRIIDPGDQSQRQIRTAVKQLDQPGTRRITVANVKMTGGVSTKVAHQLGKVPVGWIVTDKNAQADVWRDPAVSPTGDFIALLSSATVTVTLQFW